MISNVQIIADRVRYNHNKKLALVIDKDNNKWRVSADGQDQITPIKALVVRFNLVTKTVDEGSAVVFCSACPDNENGVRRSGYGTLKRQVVLKW